MMANARNNDTAGSIATNNDAISYPGGKGNCYQQIINLIPPHHTYITPFVGGGAVLRNIRPAACTIAIDSDASAIKQLGSRIAKSDDATRYTLIVGNALEWLRNHTFTGNEFIYADPPYLMSTRRGHRQLYRYELATEAEHNQLLDILTVVPCNVMISGYWSELYADRLSDWHTHNFQAITRGGTMATEWLWMNYPSPTRLHDYQYLGTDFRERERIKRKATRWANKFEGLDILERRAIMAQLEKWL